jgi:MFS transporter, DHA1 family, inner membrane transport protein
MEKLTKKEITLLLTLALVQFTHILDGMIMMPMAPNLKLSMTIDSQHFGFLVASYGFAAFISAIGATFWMDRFDRKKVLLFLYSGFLLGTLSCGLAPSYEFLLGSRLFTGFFGGVAGAVIMSIIGDVLPLEKRGRGMGILMMGFAFASVAGIPAGIFLSETYSWHAPFLLIVAIGCFVLAAIFFFIPSVTIHMQPGKPRQPHILKTIGSNPNQIRALLFSLTVVISHFGIIPYISDYMVNNNGFVLRTELIFLYIVGGLFTVITSPLFGKMADKYGRFKVYAVLNTFSVIPIYMISNFNSHSFWMMIGVSAMFFVFSGARFGPMAAIITSTVEPQSRGGFMSLNSALQQLGAALCAFVGGAIISNAPDGKLVHYERVGYVAIGMTVLAFLIGYGVKVIGEKGR